MILFAYSHKSRTAKQLASAARIKLVSPRKLVKLPDDVIINWGSTHPILNNYKVINKPYAVATSIDKILTFETLKAKQIPVPRYTTDRVTAIIWKDDYKNTLFARQNSLYGGKGIEIVQPINLLPENADFFTVHIPRAKEYRVHVFMGEVLSAQQKKKKRDTEVNAYIRSYKNGWVFARNNIDVPQLVMDTAVAAVKALELDFGAVDLLYKNNNAIVLEVNTAPGLQGTTLNEYATAIKNLALPESPSI